MSKPKHGNPVPVTVWLNGDNAKYLIDGDEPISKHVNRLVTAERTGETPCGGTCAELENWTSDANAWCEIAHDRLEALSNKVEKIKVLEEEVEVLRRVRDGLRMELEERESAMEQAQEKIMELEECSSRHHYEAVCARRELGLLRRKMEEKP